MNIQLFYPEWTFLHTVQNPNAVHLDIQPVSSASRCHSCRRLSRRIHSCYWKTLQDTPIRSMPIVLHVRARKFFCDQPECSRKIFTERQLDAFLKQLAFSSVLNLPVVFPTIMGLPQGPIPFCRSSERKSFFR